MAKRQIPIRVLYPSGTPWASIDKVGVQVSLVLQIWDGTSEVLHRIVVERDHLTELRDVVNGSGDELFGSI